MSAFAGTPVTELGDWAGLLVSNAEQAGVVQIAYVYSDGTSESLENGLADESGVLVQLRFPVNCGGAPPTGIDALLSVTELKVHLAAEDGGLDLAPVLSVPGTVSFCKTVPNQEHSFGTLKARYQ